MGKSPSIISPIQNQIDIELLINLISYFFVNLKECSKRIKYSQNILRMKNLLEQTYINENKFENKNIFDEGMFKSYDFKIKPKQVKKKKKISEKVLLSDSKIDINEAEENLKKKKKTSKKKKLNQSVRSMQLDISSSDFSPVYPKTKKKSILNKENDDFNVNPLNYSSMTATNYSSFNNNNIGSRQRAKNFSNKIRNPLNKGRSNNLNKNVGKFTNSNWINTLSNLSYFKKK